MNEELRQYLAAMEARLVKHVSDEVFNLETKLLTEFHKWGSTSDVRTRQSLSTGAAISERLTLAEDRISELERRRAN